MKFQFIHRTADEHSFRFSFGVVVAFDRDGIVFEVMFGPWDWQINYVKEYLCQNDLDA